VATFSTWSELSKTEDGENADNMDPEMVVTSVSDADSSNDSNKVLANSVQGEDDLVDVSMKDAGEPSADVSPKGKKILKEFTGLRPKWVDPEEFLSPQLQNLFELCYFTDHSVGNGVPTGWNSVDDNKSYQRLASRAPPETPESADGDTQSPSNWTNGAASDNETSNDELSQQPEAAPTRMTEESSEEEAPIKQPKVYRNNLLQYFTNDC
jgi:ubiquitin carboxyl-terminal hydrolase 4/11